MDTAEAKRLAVTTGVFLRPAIKTSLPLPEPAKLADAACAYALPVAFSTDSKTRLQVVERGVAEAGIAARRLLDDPVQEFYALQLAVSGHLLVHGTPSLHFPENPHLTQQLKPAHESLNSAPNLRPNNNHELRALRTMQDAIVRIKMFIPIDSLAQKIMRRLPLQDTLQEEIIQLLQGILHAQDGENLLNIEVSQALARHIVDIRSATIHAAASPAFTLTRPYSASSRRLSRLGIPHTVR